MEIFYWIGNYLLEFLKLNIFVFGIFNCPSKGKRRQWIPSVVAAVVIGVVALLSPKEDYIIYSITALLILNMFLALERKKDIFLAFLAFIIMSSVEVILDGTLQIICDKVMLDILGRDIINFLINLFSGICILLLDGLMHKGKERLYYSAKNVMLVFMGLLGMMFYLYPIQYSYGILERDSKMLQDFLVGVFLSSLLFFLICFVNLKSINDKEVYRERARAYENYVEKQELYYKELLQKEKATRQFRHDILNHLFCLQCYLEEGETERAAEYIKDMAGTLKKLSEKVLTGNDTLDIVAADVFREEKEVKLVWRGRFPAKAAISDMDLCILFSNLLKNALEAARGYEGDSKEVTVTIRGLGYTYLIYVKNPCNKKPEIQGNEFLTSKEDKENHGFGMRNIEQVLNKYAGIVKYDYSAPFFQTEIALENIVIEEKYNNVDVYRQKSTFTED